MGMRIRFGERQRLAVAAIAFTVSLLATVAGGLLRPSDAPAEPADGGAAATAAAPQAVKVDPRVIPVGIAYGDTLTWKSDKDLAAGLDDAVNTGSQWIRVDLSWNNIQPENNGRYEWHRFDRVVDAANARNLKVLATIAYTPAWARKSGCGSDPSCPPAKPEQFAAFAKAAAQRYAPKGVHTWEVWNEPNLPFWAPKPDPAGYTKLLDVTSKALRAADSKAFLLLGGLGAVGTDPSLGYVSQTEFLEAVCKLGANRMVDAISYHPYTYPYLPSAKTSFGTAMEQISSTKDNLVGVLAANGTPDLPVWLTETGAPTNGPGTATDGKNFGSETTHVTEEYQAQIAADTVPAAVANPHVGAVFWFADQDTGRDKDKQRRSLFYGLRHYDGRAKPALEAWKGAVTAYERTLAPASAPAGPPSTSAAG
ncbi:cellulase family glycosylhydrolase [Kitasatospora phosalacinea]|uniref:cellulase family glycosylhydrolase n=1 Tax=Kitasatospora phosalacinea TaxID=2065 RepID=UPI00364F8DA1